MTRVYWSARRVSKPLILLVTLLALGAVAAVERWPRPVAGELEQRKHAAAELAERGLDSLRTERLRRGIPIEPDLDPAETGMIGTRVSPVTSVSGHLGSKRTSVNPNWAAVVVQMLHESGVGPGDRVAVGCSGSFPSLNLCVYAAIETIGAEPVVVASAAGSQFGANFPEWMWIDMERHLAEEGVLKSRAVAASRGGAEDGAARMTAEGQRLVDEAIERNGLEKLQASDFAFAIDERMVVFDRPTGQGTDEFGTGTVRPIKAYVNVGGGAVSTGHSLGKKLYEPGLNLAPPPGATLVDSVMTRFANRGVPILHLVQIVDLAELYGLPVEPTSRPRVGSGDVYVRPEPSRWLSVGGLLVVVAAMLLVCLRRRTTTATVAEPGEPRVAILAESTSRAA